MITSKADAKIIRSVINKLVDGPNFSVAHAKQTYKNYLSHHSIISQLNLLLPTNEQVTFHKPMVQENDESST